MSKQFTIAFVPFDAFGHVNACLGLAQTLRQFGHKCVFIVNQTWKELISGLGFDHQIYIEEHKGKKGNEFWNDFMVEFAPTLQLSSFQQIRTFESYGWGPITEDVKKFNGNVKNIIEDLKPDAIVVDSLLCIPAVVCAGIPWIDLISCNPLYYWVDERLPPGGSGYPTNGDKKLWAEFKSECEDAFSKDWESFNSWVQSVGAPALKNRGKFCISSPYLNLYLSPQELSYDEIAPKDKTYHSIDSMIRLDIQNDNKVFEIPEKLRQRSGKLIYLSMGTMCCSEINLMKRLVSLLSDSEHRIIVSKGPLGHKYQLPDNMWGQNSLPQIQVLPLVDLVLTHGGNNTVTESLYFGKPMIVLPVFADQYDNAQRIVEKGLGVRLDPYFCTKTQLSEAIEKLINDSELKERFEKISQRIKSSESREMAAKLTQNVILKAKK